MFESEASPRRLLGQEGYAAVAAVAPLTCLTSVTTISFSPRIVAAAHGMEIENGIKGCAVSTDVASGHPR